MKVGRGCIYSQGSHSMMLRDTWHSYLPPTPLLELTSFNPEFLTTFYHLFRDSFWRLSGAQNRSCVVPLESLRSLLSNNIKFAQIRVRTEKLWLPEVRVSEQFFCVFTAKIPAKTGDVTGESRVARRSRGYLLS
jgi:hypothetical protein